MKNKITIIKPDDWHLHLRSGKALEAVVEMTAAQMGRAIIMPNLNPPVVNAAQAQAYKNAILEALPAGSNFEPLMVLYLTDNEATFDSLTNREKEVACQVAHGHSNKVIARELGISDGTVKLHVKSILKKLSLSSRVEVAVMITEKGYCK